jgi:hypothetical protein
MAVTPSDECCASVSSRFIGRPFDLQFPRRLFREGGGIKGSNHGLAAFGEGSLAAVSISSFAVKCLLVPPKLAYQARHADSDEQFFETERAETCE